MHNTNTPAIKMFPKQRKNASTVHQKNFATSQEDLSTLGMDKTQDVRHTKDMLRLFTFNDVCSRLSICRSTLYRLLKDDSINAVKIGNRTLFREADIRNFIDNLPVKEVRNEL